MKIAIVAPSPVPFLIGGAEKFLWGLQAAINQMTPHDAELIKIPCRDQEFWPLMEAYQRMHHLDLGYFDRVISTKYPAWMVQHPAHDVYMQHPCRGVYDLYRYRRQSTKMPDHRALKGIREFLDIPRPDNHLLEPFFATLFALRDRDDIPARVFEFPGPLTRSIIRFLDRTALCRKNISRYFAISGNVIAREGYFPEGAEVKALHHPTDIRGLYTRGYDYLFTASRLEELKRIDLLIKAFKRVKADIPFKIAGTGGLETRLRQMAAGDDRIEFLGFVSDERLIDYYAGALFVPFIPYDEDYGLITLEAMLSGKPVLTTSDAGGVTELVTHGVDGIITEPEPSALAGAMNRLIKNPEKTIRMGKTARKNARHITWKNTVAQLFDPSDTGRRSEVSALSIAGGPWVRKKIVMINDYSVTPPLGGGQKRIYHLCLNLAAGGAEVTLVTFGNRLAGPFRHVIGEGATEIRFPKNRAQIKAEKKLRKTLKASANDIAAIPAHELNPAFLRFLEQKLEDADLVICAHPYMYRAVEKVWDGPLWLDEHNVEADMKGLVLPASGNRDKALRQVMAVERDCIQEADLVCCVSEADRLRLMELYGSLPDSLIVPNGKDFNGKALYSAEAEAEDASNPDLLRHRLGISAPVAVFIGSYHAPNNRALKSLCKIADHCPGIFFFIIGSVCHSRERAHVPENMRLLGVLSEGEKAVVFRAADLALNPVDHGSGSNLKIIEYMAYGLPVLSTPCGVRGYELEDGSHLWIRELEAFPRAITEMTSSDLQTEMITMAERAHMHARAIYDWSAVCDPLIEQLQCS